jgi:hypothetical protein
VSENLCKDCVNMGTIIDEIYLVLQLPDDFDELSTTLCHDIIYDYVDSVGIMINDTIII